MLTVMREATEAVSGNTYPSVSRWKPFCRKGTKMLDRTPRCSGIESGVVDLAALTDLYHGRYAPVSAR